MKLIIIFSQVKSLVKLSPLVIKVSGTDYNWIPILQKALIAEETSVKQKIILLSQGEPLSGIVGFFNCIRKETGGERVR